MDWVACAQSVLEAMRADSGRSLAEGIAGGTRDAMPDGIPEMMPLATRDAADAVAKIRTAVELLARGWPEDYPTGAVEWFLLPVRCAT
jgi:hypothetical protein